MPESPTDLPQSHATGAKNAAVTALTTAPFLEAIGMAFIRLSPRTELPIVQSNSRGPEFILFLITFVVISTAQFSPSHVPTATAPETKAALAEFERELIIERTQAGLKAARARGRKGGRPRKMDVHTLKMAMAAMSDQKSIAAEVAKRLNITTITLYMYVNGDGTPKEHGVKLLQNVNP